MSEWNVPSAPPFRSRRVMHPPATEEPAADLPPEPPPPPDTTPSPLDWLRAQFGEARRTSGVTQPSVLNRLFGGNFITPGVGVESGRVPPGVFTSTSATPAGAVPGAEGGASPADPTAALTELRRPPGLVGPVHPAETPPVAPGTLEPTARPPAGFEWGPYERGGPPSKEEQPGAPGRGTPGALRTRDGRPDFPNMPPWMKAMPPELRRMFPPATGRERRPGVSRETRANIRSLPPFMRQLLRGNTPLAGFFNQLMRMRPDLTPPPQPELDVPDPRQDLDRNRLNELDVPDPRQDLEAEGGDNVSPAGSGMGAGTGGGRGAAARPDGAPAAGAAATPGRAGAPETQDAARVSEPASVPPGAAPGGIPGTSPPPTGPADGGAADLSPAGLATPARIPSAPGAGEEARRRLSALPPIERSQRQITESQQLNDASRAGYGVSHLTGVPERVLQGARRAAALGGPGAVFAFMRQNGYPRAGNWCGEFAAAVMHSQGLPIPKNPAIASNWRNWGTPTTTPRPGDVAVRRGVRTGDTGSHVTMIERVYPDGSMDIIGGNQRQMREHVSRQYISRYVFRTWPTQAAESTAVSRETSPQR